MMSVRAILDSRFARNLVHMLYGNFALTLLQGVQFIVLAKVLGPREFGMFASTAAVVMAVMPFAGFGLANVTIMRGARDPNVIPVYLTASIVATAASAVLLTLALVVAAPLLLGDATTAALTACVCVTELLFTKMMDACGHAFIAVHEMRRTSQFMLLPSLLRLLMLGIFVAYGLHTSEVWVLFAAAAHGLAFAIAACLTFSRFGAAPFEMQIVRREWKHGAHFAYILTSKAIFMDADKAILGRLAGPVAAGIYTWSSRIVQISLSPINALSVTTQPKLFADGQQGVKGAWHSGRRLLGISACYGLVMGAGIWLCAPIVPLVLGNGFSDTVPMLRWMAPLPILLATQAALANVVLSGGESEVTSIMYGIAAVVTIVGCFVCIKWIGWRGAIVASYCAQLTLVAMLACHVRSRIVGYQWSLPSWRWRP